MKTVTRSIRLMCAAALAVGLVAGCDAGNDGVPQSQLQDSIKSNLNEQNATDGKVTSVDCPHGLKAEVGDSVTCKANLENGKSVDVDVRVDSVDGSTVHYSMRPKASAGSTSVAG